MKEKVISEEEWQIIEDRLKDMPKELKFGII